MTTIEIRCKAGAREAEQIEEERKKAEELKQREIAIPEHTEVKPYMDYRTVTDTSSTQYKILSMANANADGIMMVQNYYCVALGAYFGAVGTKYTAIIGGEEYHLIKADEKQDRHTLNGEGKTGADGHLIEVVVCTEKLNEYARTSGNCNNLIPGKVEKIWRE